MIQVCSLEIDATKAASEQPEPERLWEACEQEPIVLKDNVGRFWANDAPTRPLAAAIQWQLWR